MALPQRDVGDRESDDDAMRELIGPLPFARDVVRREQCALCTAPDRVDHRREIAIVSWAVVRAAHRGEEASESRGSWQAIERLPLMVADHAGIVQAAKRALDGQILNDPVTRRVLPRHLLRAAADAIGIGPATATAQPALFGLLPDPFPLSAIRRFYERLLTAPIDRGNFRRKLVELRPTGILKELPIFQRGVRHRAAQLFTFDAQAWEQWASNNEPD
ncbi:MAG: hypothetical protein SGJ11_06490 [Phycisphaerae bacterium]|nr:hypothetical protein [Phycisphaerae bacterium]